MRLLGLRRAGLALFPCHRNVAPVDGHSRHHAAVGSGRDVARQLAPPLHLTRQNRLVQELEQDAIDESWLEKVEEEDNIFPDIDYRIFG